MKQKVIPVLASGCDMKHHHLRSSKKAALFCTAFYTYLRDGLKVMMNLEDQKELI